MSLEYDKENYCNNIQSPHIWVAQCSPKNSTKQTPRSVTPLQKKNNALQKVPRRRLAFSPRPAKTVSCTDVHQVASPVKCSPVEQRRRVRTPRKNASPHLDSYDTFGFLKIGGEEEFHDPETHVRPEEEMLRLWTQILEEWEQWQDGRLQYLIFCEGIPEKLRVEVWKKFLKVEKFMEGKEDLYEILVAEAGDPLCCEQIRLDTRRTFGTHKFFKTIEGREKLYNTLKAYSIYNKEVGYCQGMSFVCAALLMYMSEKDAFWMMVALLDNIQSNFHPSMTGILEGNETFWKLLKLHNPAVRAHLEKLQTPTLIFISRWFLTLFTDLSNWRTVLRLWDIIIFEGTVALYRIALALVCCCEKELLMCKVLEQAIPFLLHISKEKLEPKNLIPAVFQVDIDALMNQLKEESNNPQMSDLAFASPPGTVNSIFSFVNQLFMNDSPPAKGHSNRNGRKKLSATKSRFGSLSFSFLRKNHPDNSPFYNSNDKCPDSPPDSEVGYVSLSGRKRSLPPRLQNSNKKSKF